MISLISRQLNRKKTTFFGNLTRADMSWPSSSSDGDGEEEFVVEIQDKSMVLSHRVKAR